MRSTKPAVVAGPSFLAGIHDKIAKEDEYHNIQLVDQIDSESNQKKSWLRPVGGFALAASFAAVAFVGVQNYQLNNQLSQQTAPTIAAVQTPEATPVASVEDIAVTKEPAQKTVDQYREANSHARSFLKRYVDSHVQYASTSTFVPSVRVIAYADY
jgi:negative regulator of sigma E activity